MFVFNLFKPYFYSSIAICFITTHLALSDHLGYRFIPGRVIDPAEEIVVPAARDPEELTHKAYGILGSAMVDD